MPGSASSKVLGESGMCTPMPYTDGIIVVAAIMWAGYEMVSRHCFSLLGVKEHSFGGPFFSLLTAMSG